MQVINLPTSAAAATLRPVTVATGQSPSVYQGYQIIRRNGSVVSFEPSKIAVALMKAFLAVHGTQGAASASVRETVDGLTEVVVRALLRSRPGGGTFHIEDIQDQVELGLMRGGHHEVARAYVLYRERRAQEPAEDPGADGQLGHAGNAEGSRQRVDRHRREGHREQPARKQARPAPARAAQTATGDPATIRGWSRWS